MFDINYLAEFSRTNCVAICVFLVPANIVATNVVLMSLYWQRPSRQVLPLIVSAAILACALFLHVATWLMIGVVMPPTFILLALGLTCLMVNLKAGLDAAGLTKFLHWLVGLIRSRFFPLLAK
jgi:hypothetical protein